MALKEHPYLNATVDEASGDLLLHSEQNIGVAVHTEDGLLVPVLRNVEQRHLLDLAREIERLSAAARTGKLSREEVTGSTFSITSLGQLGGMHGTPMLNTPEVAVLGIHRIQERPAVRDGAIVPRHLGNLSLTLDHRYIDGYIGAQFAQTLVKYLEDPAVMLFWLSELRDHIGAPDGEPESVE
jgi:pyruvate dehydrogenase E2 component (dihydrolipoamide acetyltransferase)